MNVPLKINRYDVGLLIEALDLYVHEYETRYHKTAEDAIDLRTYLKTACADLDADGGES